MSLGTILIIFWFVLALALSVTGWFEQFSSEAVFGMGGVVLFGFGLSLFFSQRIRDYTLSRSLQGLTRVQAVRLFGILAFIKAHQNVLPAVFAIPTGIFDVSMAITSFFVAERLVSPEGRPSPVFFVWHVLGLIALGISVVLAFWTSSTRFGLTHEITSQAMARFPMNLTPAFFGPLTLLYHLLALGAARFIAQDLNRSKGVNGIRESAARDNSAVDRSM